MADRIWRSADVQIESVQIEAFGPFTSCKLEFAPGFTVVYGPNESGKSTWHAATYAALCGMRRTRGRHADDQRFAERHRPWDSNRWLVVGVVTLQDGRRIELRQNLDDKVDCAAIDLVLGGDVSAEIIGEGSPDAAIWLGMDRHTFLATGCIRQADVLSIRESAGALQEHLQRAASTAGVDATAAKALDLLDAFQREQVGRDIANSIRPLRRAIERSELAGSALALAQDEHAQFLTRSRLADERADEANNVARTRRLFEGAMATQRAKDAARALDRARLLRYQYSGRPATDLASDDLLAQRVAAALQAFDSRPEPTVLDGPTSEQLVEQLVQLPSEPEGDTKPDDSVVRAKATWDGVAHALSVHDAQRPPEAEALAVAQTADGLRQLALQLQREQQPVTGPALGLSVLRWPALIAGAILLIVGLLVALGGHQLLGALAAVVGVAVSAAGAILALRRRSPGDNRSQAAGPRFQGPASRRLEELGLPADPTQLLALADRVEGVERQRTLIAAWVGGRQELTNQLRAAAQNLRQDLEARFVAVDADLGGAYTHYVQECESRAQQAATAKRRVDLEARLEQRRVLETGAASVAKQRESAEIELSAVGAACGVGDGADELIVVGLRDWLRRRDDQLGANRVELADRAELRSLLGTGTLDDLKAVEERLHADADQLAAAFSDADVAAVELGTNPESRLRELQTAEREAAGAAQRARGEIQALKARIHDVPAAEEEMAAADAALAKTRELDQTLSSTRQYLEAAQERVHRDIAPLLASTLNSWLPRITDGRYQQAIVDPQTLAVQIRYEAGKWRDASLVSDGTREQVYLLLRMALAQRLTKKGEVAPLLLDEVTVQSDAHRTAAILKLLHEMSAEVQVILFTQEDEVRSWAEANLTGSRDRLQLLEMAPVPA